MFLSMLLVLLSRAVLRRLWLVVSPARCCGGIATW